MIYATAPIAMPTIAEGDNWAEIGTAAWIAEYGGIDVTGAHGEGDYADWLGDVEIDGTVYRLTCCGHRIYAEEAAA